MKVITLTLTVFWSLALLAQGPQTHCLANFDNRLGFSTKSDFNIPLEDYSYDRSWKYEKHTLQIN